MKTSRSLSACLLALVAWPVLGFSEDVKKDTPAAADASPPQIIDEINIKNVTYGELADLLRKKTGKNIVVSPVLQKEMAPDLVLHHVTIEDVMRLMGLVTGLYADTYSDDDDWFLTPPKDASSVIQQWAFRAEPNETNEKICRVFKASAKEKLASPQLDQLLANISEAARKVCAVKAKAQGRPAAEPPVIEADAGTGTLIVAGTESDVQLVGQLIQAMGGKAVPLTGGVTPSTGRKIFDTRAPLVTPQGKLTRSGSPDGTNALEDMREQIDDLRKEILGARIDVDDLKTLLAPPGQQPPPDAEK
ncbi:MAG: hypothetical protein ABJF10_22460 [Chthoniobacter sp.]|uniref:hypothetical protein n=1 Tax=Chthoniobacter sp. TaxID=2510640 RepID=UPI0032A4FBB5